MASDPLQSSIAELERIFRSCKDHYRSHEFSRKVLLEMSAHPQFLAMLFKRHLSDPANLNRCNFPIPGLMVAENPYFTCSVNFWLGGMPQLEQQRSMTCVHHHGALLLTTLAIMGPGAEVWSFSKPRQTETDNLYRMDLLTKEVNTKGRYTFVDSGYCHMIYPPTALSATITLWSKARHNQILNFLKYNSLIRRNRQRLSAAVRLFKMGGVLQVNEVINFDFIPRAGGFEALPCRLQYPYTTNDDYLDNLFHLLGETGNAGQLGGIHDTLEKYGAQVSDPAGVTARIRSLERGDVPGPAVSPSQSFVQGLTVTRAEVLRGLGQE